MIFYQDPLHKQQATAEGETASLLHGSKQQSTAATNAVVSAQLHPDYYPSDSSSASNYADSSSVTSTSESAVVVDSNTSATGTINSGDLKKKHSFEYRLTFILFLTFLAAVFVGTGIASVLLAFHGREHELSLMYARLNGLLASALTFIQWTPQILRTYRQKSAGNFSILMICIMLPGAFITIAYMIFVAKQSITTWLSYLCSGIQQAILFSLLVFYETKNCILKRKQGDASLSKIAEVESSSSSSGNAKSFTVDPIDDRPSGYA